MKHQLVRRCAAEFLGTFGIVFAPVALSACGAYPGAETGAAASAIVSGLAVAAMIATFGPISEAHFNPAVTLGLCTAGRFAPEEAPAYCLAQFTGGAAAAALAALLLKPGAGTHLPALAAGKAVGFEAVITFLLMLVILAVSTSYSKGSALPPLAIGAAVTMNVLIGAAATGGSMNPARSLGPALFGSTEAREAVWIYLCGPALGAVPAAWVFRLLYPAGLPPGRPRGGPAAPIN
jgi:MIP family channel proteins